MELFKQELYYYLNNTTEIDDIPGYWVRLEKERRDIQEEEEECLCI